MRLDYRSLEDLTNHSAVKIASNCSFVSKIWSQITGSANSTWHPFGLIRLFNSIGVLLSGDFLWRLDSLGGPGVVAAVLYKLYIALCLRSKLEGNA